MTLAQKLNNWFFNYQGSTRPVAIIRIGLAILLLYRFTYAGHLIKLHDVVTGPLFFVAILCMLFGYKGQLAAFVAGLIAFGGWYYFGALELGGAKLAHGYWHHNTYILSFAVLLLSLTPCSRSFSVDRLLAEMKADRDGVAPPAEEGNLFGARIIAVQMAALYFFAFWDKVILQGTNHLHTAFLSGERLQAIILNSYWGSSVEVPLLAIYLAGAASVAVALLELALPLLLVERFQKWLIIPGFMLHIAFYVMLSLATYSLTCMLLYLAIIDANKTAGFIDALGPKLRRVSQRLAPA